MERDIDPAALTRVDSFSQATPIPALSSKINGVSAPGSQKASKSVNSAQRIDLEPLYTSLKAAIGDNWGSYKEAISLFVLGMHWGTAYSPCPICIAFTKVGGPLLGHLNQNELSLRTDHYLTTDPTTEHLHNQLIAAIYGNVPRDLPDQGVAPWVSANDKPMLLSKPMSGDAAEQRLKIEVMQLPARDRRRLKEVPDVSSGSIWLRCLLAVGKENGAQSHAYNLLYYTDRPLRPSCQ